MLALVFVQFCLNNSILATVFVNADPNKAGSSRITKTANAQSDGTSSTPDKDDKTKQTEDCVDSPSMNQNDSKQKIQEYSRLFKTTGAINLFFEKHGSTDQLSPCRATTDVLLRSENLTKEGKLK